MEGDGVLGNLPRSRPGRRSDKRTGSSAAKAAKTSERSGSRASETPQEPAPPPLPERGSDPVGDVVRTAAKVAETSVRVGVGVARELLRRLPRP